MRKKKVSSVEEEASIDAEAEKDKQVLLKLKKAGNRKEYVKTQNAILNKYGSAEEFMRRLGIPAS